MTQTYLARNAVDLIALVPQLLGFHPQESVVLMTFGPPGESFHARIDLPGEAEGHAEVARLLVDATTRHGLERAAVLVFSAQPEVARDQCRFLIAGFADAGVRVIEAIRVHAGRFHDALDLADPGRAYDVAAHPFTARGVFEGHVVEESREALAATLVGPVEPSVHRAVQAHLGAWSPRDVSWFATTLGRHVRRAHERRCGAEPAARRTSARADVAGRMIALCACPQVREQTWQAMTRANAPDHVAVLRDLVRRAPAEARSAPASLLALAAWLAGDGALAWCAIDLCAGDDDCGALAGVVAELLTRAVSPRDWERARRRVA